MGTPTLGCGLVIWFHKANLCVVHADSHLTVPTYHLECLSS